MSSQDTSPQHTAVWSKGTAVLTSHQHLNTSALPSRQVSSPGPMTTQLPLKTRIELPFLFYSLCWPAHASRIATVLGHYPCHASSTTLHQFVFSCSFCYCHEGKLPRNFPFRKQLLFQAVKNKWVVAFCLMNYGYCTRQVFFFGYFQA